MKLLTIAIPCYNSAKYMSHAIETALSGGKDVEIIIVNDGSKDETSEIGAKYEKEYPDIVKLVNQENGGHGEAVNTGLKNATGVFFKVLDSDDWLDEESLQKIINTIKTFIHNGDSVDMIVSNFVYEKQGQLVKKVMSYRNALPTDKIFSWEEWNKFRIGQYILMHSVIYRTKLLRDCGLKLPKHTFYVDNIFVFQPLPYVKNMYYVDTNFYRYFIGREDQSVNEAVMISRIDQQIRVNKMMIDIYEEVDNKPKQLKAYMIMYLSIIMTVSSVLLIKEGSEESLEKKNELWNYLKDKNKGLYKKIRSTLLGRSMNLPGKAGRKMSILGYKISRKIYGFN